MVRDWQIDAITVNGMVVELRSIGEGPPLVILQGEDTNRELLPFQKGLSERFRVMVPSLPGLGGSHRPDWLDSVDDVAYLMLDLVETLNHDAVNLLGIGFGGWVAAEMAVRCQKHLRSLVLADSVGIKVSEPWVRDIADIFVLNHEEFARLAWHDPMAAVLMKQPGAPGVSEEELLELLRNRQVLLLLGWSPFMYNPKLLHRLDRVKGPVLILWGRSDRVVSPEYGRVFHQAIQGSEFKVIEQAGHYPHLEQPEEFVRIVMEFLL